jgi:hypothetical protein
MITNDGKSIIGKYLINQAPSYAGYLAVGCGSDPDNYQSAVPTAWSISGSTVTVTLSGHNFLVGESIIINFNDSRVDGIKTVATANATALTFTATTAIPTSITAVDDVNPESGAALFTTATAHNLRVGDLVTTTGFTDPDFNTVDRVVYTVPSTTTFSVAPETGTGTTSAGTLSTVKPNRVDPNAIIIRNYANKKTLDYEMFRVPIISRAFNSQTGETQVILTAELPTQDRYLMTEAAVFSSGTNPIATLSDSRPIYAFSEGEGWEEHEDESATAITTFTATSIANVNGVINTLNTTIANLTAFALDSTDAMFDADAHKLANSKPRLLSNFIVVRGDLSQIDTTGSTWTAIDAPHIHIQNQRFGFGVNSSTDQLKLAFSVINRNPISGANAAVAPVNAYVMVEFSTSEAEVEADNQYARMQIQLSSTDFANVNGSRYFVSTKTLGELATSVGFSWEAVRLVKVYVEIEPPTTLNNTVTKKRLSSTGNTLATLTMGTLSHKLRPGDQVTIAGVGSPFDGTFAISAVDSDNADLDKNYIRYNLPEQPSAISNTAVSPAGTATFTGGNYYVLFDGLRFENIADLELNPLYGMTAYTTLNDLDTVANVATRVPITKDVNTNTLLEFRLNLELNAEG